MRRLLPILAALLCLPMPAISAAPATLWDQTSYATRGTLAPASAETAVADANGDLHIVATQFDGAGSCIVAFKHVAVSGVVAWRREACGGADTHAVSIAVDGGGNVVIAGNSGGMFRLIKYSGATGSPLWEQRFAGGGLETVLGLAVTSGGDIFMMGRSVSPSSEIWIAKHRGADGTLMWQQPVDAGAEVTAAGIAVDVAGNAYVTGSYRNSRGDEDWHLARLAGSSGAVVWRKIHDSGGRDVAAAITVDAAGDVVVAGTSWSSTSAAIRVVKSAAGTGRTLWEASHPFSRRGHVAAVKSDSSANIVVTGSVDDGMRTLRYRAADGASMWTAGHGGSSAGAAGHALAFDARGNVLVTGRTVAPGGSGELRTIKYSATDGSVSWTAAQAAHGGEDSGRAVVAAAGGIYTVARYTDGQGRSTLRTTRYSEAAAPAAINVQGLWWQSTESGWGVNLTQQGDVLFATWFTYDEQGQGLWLVMSNGARVGDNSYGGTLYRTTGPPFSAQPFEPAKVAVQPVGTASFTFADDARGVFAYTVDGVSGSKAITRQVYASPAPTCALDAPAPSLPNYQDLWWSAGGTESGWGLNVTHQGDVLFVTWFTYGSDGRGMWLVGSNLTKTGNATFAGTLYRTTGPPFAQQPWDASRVGVAAAGHANLVFSDRDTGTFTYTLDGISQSKAIARQVYASPKTSCY